MHTGGHVDVEARLTRHAFALEYIVEGAFVVLGLKRLLSHGERRFKPTNKEDVMCVQRWDSAVQSPIEGDR